MKKFLSLILVFCIVLSGCSPKSTPTENEVTPTITSEPTATEKPTLTPTSAPTSTPTPTVTSAPTSTPTPTITPEPTLAVAEKTLDLTTDQFIENVNRNFKVLESSLQASKPKVTEYETILVSEINEYNVYSLPFDSSTKKLTSIIYIGQGDGSSESGMDILYSLVATVLSISESMYDTATASEMIVEMFDEAMSSGDSSRILNNLSYTLTRSDELGTWLIIEPAE